ncbi:dTDP-4-amino-4,6-dideoxygalactose transaminase [Vibrio parahaemolyticus]|uniref:dTDP-4-amino-4,6-dideoxygalactose transaminase n=1 Tax=Vibrio parahaemolyticus TaxID=670 RepID=A0A7M1WD62_VIBPH|nr:dTDP-4-amino-4,6-dideoxygalactose transaminase [Vibrio parahaemolyticus]ELA7156567.1 dTDP-4-amino-4,6-dideoxygalactose transaminase [Vibrio parahaemolyticus]ELB2086918.1 dTDP-4-amino-4,6-dideoxygalactose transaminase [Vibrio parahaemolyticus]ELB2920167.1 dTDP-4-amino-4,6-dideoxygalactose transaminase [Vibrio parahaemolyticus]MCR9851999.1 dTDP-4-amino-4,6-dideoxygalactose transaminase [Vibrio parahaemolyticus]MDF4398126.1 dTDP-4-amino-4,6-dideoxygalactose transaminase [Vibrio parahaemolyticu
MIPFNKPPVTGQEIKYIQQVLCSEKMCGDGPFGKKCQEWFETTFMCEKSLFTPSCTHALELAALLIDIKPGDEVIMPSYTFVSTANPFVLRGANIVFVDIRPDTMNIDESLIEEAITEKTKAIVPVHYAGVACEMDTIMALADKYSLFVIEDAAQGVMSTYKRKALGTIGHLGAYSFHETKNYTSGGEGGLLLINDPKLIERAEIIREKGTDRSKFFRGMVDKYSWVDLGSSYLPSEVQAACLYAQLENADEINDSRLMTWNRYKKKLNELVLAGKISFPVVPKYCNHNAHMFYIKVANVQERTALIEYLKESGINCAFHYVPLHSARAGENFSRFNGEDRYTTKESERLVRLPLWYGMSEDDVIAISSAIFEFYA